MNITIIGAGLASYNLVRFLRKKNFPDEIVVISACDGTQYYKPKLSVGFSNGMRPSDHVTEQAQDWAEKYAVRLIGNTWVEKIDVEKNRLFTTSGDYDYDKLVLAYGARPRKLPASNDFREVIRNVNSLGSYEDLFYEIQRKNTAPTLIGAGLVGCELASDLANAGISSTIISSGPYPLHALFPQEFGEFIKKRLMGAGVRFIDNAKVSMLEKISGGINLILSSGGSHTSPLVINCAGLEVETDLASNAGVKTQAGIITNEYLQSNIENIYAIGDCAQINGQQHQFVAPILISARALASTLLGKPSKVNLTFYPVEIKIQQSATRFVIKGQPDQWITESTSEGMIARGYKNERLSALAVTGDANNLLNELMTAMVV